MGELKLLLKFESKRYLFKDMRVSTWLGQLSEQFTGKVCMSLGADDTSVKSCITKMQFAAEIRKPEEIS